MSRDVRAFLEDMLDAARTARLFTGDLDKHSLAADRRTLDAVVRNLEVLGEAAKHIPQEFRDEYPEIDWRRIAGLRDVLIHGYFNINLRLLWDVVSTRLGPLEHQLERVLADLERRGDGDASDS